MVLGKREKTEKVLINICNLPPMNETLTEAFKLLNDESTSTSTLSKVVSRDQGLVTKILTVANSPMYGLQRHISTIDFAILVLGFRELKNIVTVLSLVESFINKTDNYLDQKEFWVHSYITGTAAKRLAEDLDFPNSGEAFIAGFLHDMGITIMHRYFHSDFIKIYQQAMYEGVAFNQAELNELGVSHEQIGHFLVDKWNFPAELCNAILNHHSPDSAINNRILTSLVHLADYMTQKLEIGNCYWDNDLVLDEAAIHALRFRDINEVDLFIKAYEELFAHQVDFARYLE